MPALPNPVNRSEAEAGRRKQLAASGGVGVALALGGGFSRGFAHLGVLDVLEQEHIPIAAIVGTSIGSLLGAAYADGIPVSKLCELGRRVRIRDLIRIRGTGADRQSCDRIGEFVNEWLFARRVEELSIPTAILTTDIDTCAPYVFTRGPLDVAIRASCAFPGIFQPVEYEGRRLADGCIVTPVPTAVAARMNASCVLGVDVSSSGRRASSRHNAVLVRERSPKNSRTKELSSSWAMQADLVLEPEIQHIDWSDFPRLDEAHAAGADAMRQALPYLRQLLAQRSQRVIQENARATSGRAENRVAS